MGEERAENTGEGGETEVRRRRSLLAALERVGRTEDEEEGEEEFQLPRRGDESGFSVNKCILGAVLLLGLGTIFFSGRLGAPSQYALDANVVVKGSLRLRYVTPAGVFMDLDEGRSCPEHV